MSYYQLRYQQGATTTTEPRILCTGRMNKFTAAIRTLMDESDYHLYRVVVEIAPAEAEAIRLIEAGRKVVTP